MNADPTQAHACINEQKETAVLTELPFLFCFVLILVFACL